MKTFAHPDAGQAAAADLNEALRNTLVVARNEIKYVAEVEAEYGELPQVVCHIGDLNQVFLNLLVNAAQAIEDAFGGDAAEGYVKGTISVRTRAEGDSVVVSISDTGCGIPEEFQTRVFDPFFTTKTVGRGSGQGLAIARSIVVDKHGGELTLESEPGKGTTFHIRLPAAGRRDELELEAA
jgi:signal transduction histidine kinase